LRWASNWNLDFSGVRNSSVFSYSSCGIYALLDFNSLRSRYLNLFTNSSSGRHLNLFLDFSRTCNFFVLDFSTWDLFFLLNPFLAVNFFLFGDKLEAIDFLINADEFFGWDFALVRNSLVLGDSFGAILPFLNFDGFFVWNFLLVFHQFFIWYTDRFHDFFGGFNFFGNTFVVGFVYTLGFHFGAWDLFLNGFVFKTVDFFINADHLLAGNFALVWLHFVASDGLGHGAWTAIVRLWLTWLARLADWLAWLANWLFTWKAGVFGADRRPSAG